MPKVTQKKDGGISLGGMSVSKLKDTKTSAGSLPFNVQVGEKEKMADCGKCGRGSEVFEGAGTEEARTRCAMWTEREIGGETNESLHGHKSRGERRGGKDRR